MVDINPIYLAIISIPIIILLLSLGVPIFLTLAVIGLAGVMLICGPSPALALVKTKPFYSIAQFNYIVIPLFILMGYIAYEAGVTKNAFEIGKRWMSGLPGGLAIATTMGCAFFGACCGASVATAGAMGRIAVPEMRNAGYEAKFACGVVGAGALLAMLIPPSIQLVFWGVVTETSVGALLIGGIIPGIITAIVLSLGIIFLTLRNPNLAPPVQGYSWKERFGSLRWGWHVVVLFVIVIGGIYGGVCTPGEAAALGAVTAIILAVLTLGKKSGRAIIAGFSETLRTATMLFLIIVGASLYSYFLVVAGAPAMVTEWVMTLNVPPLGVVLLALAVLVPLGMFLDSASCILINMPFFFPIVVGKLGFDPVWFGILCNKLIEIGLLTPPVGLNVYVLAGVVPDVPLTDIFRGVGWFILFEFIATGILIAFPILTLWLPSMMIAGR